MTIIRAISLLVHFTLVPLAVGRLITYRAKNDMQKSFLTTYILGFFSNLAIFYVFNSIFVWYQNATIAVEAVVGAFSKLVRTYSIVITILMVIWFISEYKRGTSIRQSIVSNFNRFKDTVRSDKFIVIYILMFIVALGIQLYAAYGYEVNEWSYDDFDYVVTSKDDISYDMISNVNMITGVAPYTSEKRVATAWPTYIAYLAYTSGFEVTTVAHTILPVLLLIVAYIVYYQLAKFIFDKTDNRLIFMILLSTAFIFGLHSHYSLTFRLLCTLWHGKAVLSAIALPFILFYLAKALSMELDNNIVFSLCAVSLGVSSLTTMSMLLLSTTVILCFIIMSICNRKIYGVRYLLASLSGSIAQLIFYGFVVLLLNRQVNPEVFGDFWFW